ncbi:DUF305 domain-containing protein [Streptomyces sp. NPDC094448]|uniref:DUF305 domain-containing protein n=1 Tax=Streptomyces sp. NPDC094448 TaxID=3366063 RepID=UPI00380AA8CB
MQGFDHTRTPAPSGAGSASGPGGRPRRRAVRRTAAVSAVLAAGLLLAACGKDDDMSGMDHGAKDSASASAAPAGGAGPAPGAFNDTDVTFAQAMIPHHQQALEMSALADGRAQDTEIIKLARVISGAQDPEIRTMKSWLKAWGKPESGGSMPGMDHGSGSSGDSTGMAGMMSEAEMAALKAAKGTDFDRKFAQLMIEHHKGAITMAEDERKNGRNATAKALAGEVIRAQQAEIDAFTKILKRL